ncbi:MAG: sigma-70 family RNA polymerase sigma factor [Clostridia bacterium]|nr:sigma-70 family RNA polymerase sigma factor [Clostridia bacterium]
MQNFLLKSLVKRVKNQDMSAFPLVFDEFKKLISFYAAKLHYEDASSELTLFLIELMYNIRLSKFPDDDGDDLKRYIAVSIKNRYITLLTARAKSQSLCENLLEGCCGCNEELDDRFCFAQGMEQLNKMQKIIVIYHFIYGYSIAEIAARFNISRQAVNKTKNQALAILREALQNYEAYFA